MLQENDRIQIRLVSHPGGQEIITRNYGKFFTVSRNQQTGQLCVPWGCPPYGDAPLLPLSSFAPTTIFEDIRTGARYRWDTTLERLTEA